MVLSIFGVKNFNHSKIIHEKIFNIACYLWYNIQSVNVGVLRGYKEPYKNEHLTERKNSKNCSNTRYGVIKEAAHYFRKSLEVRPNFLRAQRNLENLSNLIVQRWHFRMLNDSRRNEAFREAIQRKVKHGYDIVLDIGTGTGILSLFAVEAGAKTVTACDSSPFMIEVAHQVLSENGFRDIKLINKHSSEITIPNDLNEKANLVITETVDCGLVGEGILETLIDAWERLLPCHNGKSSNKAAVIPSGATIYVAGIECDEIYKKYFYSGSSDFNFVIDPIFAVQNSYDTECLKEIENGFHYLTESVQTHFVDFNNLESMRELLLEEREQIIKLKCINFGRLDCLAMWFDLHVDENITLSTGPESESCDSWDQAIFPLSSCRRVCAGEEINFKASFKNNKLEFDFIDQSEMVNDLFPSQEIIQLLNSENYKNVFLDLVETINFDEGIAILDTFAFPLFGIHYLIFNRNRDHRLTSVVRNDEDKTFVKHIAKRHQLQSQVKCLTEEEFMAYNITSKFDVILLNLIEQSGELKDSLVQRLNYLRSLLKPTGLLLPNKITMIGQFIESDWLEKNSKVINDDVTCNYKIGKFINIYRVKSHLDFDYKSISKVTRSDPFEFLTVNDGQLEKSVRVFFSSEGDANAFVYWYHIFFKSHSEPISTLDDQFTKQSAILFEKRDVGAIPENLNFFYENGLFSIENL